MAEQVTNEELDCSEGCSDEFPHKHKWEVEPNPYNSDFDVYVTDSDEESVSALVAAAESAWDECEPGYERTVTIRRNKVVGDE